MNPELPIVPSIPGATTTVEVHDAVHDVPPMSWARGPFRPTQIHIIYRHFHDERGWQASGTVTGIRIRKDGSLGADDARAYVGWPADADPDWVSEFISMHTPPEVFDLRQPDAVRYHAEATAGIDGGADTAFADTASVFLPACAQVPTHITITPAGKLRFTTTSAPNPTGYAEFTASPPAKAGSWPATYTVDSARTAAAQLLAYAHAYRTHVEGHDTASAHAEVRLVEPNSRTDRASRWDLGMSGINLRYVAPFTAFLDIPAHNQPRTLTQIAAEEWAGALLALARELDRAQVVAEHAIWADRNNLSETDWLRAWLAGRAPEMNAEQTELANRLRDELDDLDRHRTAQRAQFAAGGPATTRRATRVQG